jgi:hypothetical protein
MATIAETVQIISNNNLTPQDKAKQINLLGDEAIREYFSLPNASGEVVEALHDLRGIVLMHQVTQLLI